MSSTGRQIVNADVSAGLSVNCVFPLKRINFLFVLQFQPEIFPQKDSITLSENKRFELEQDSDLSASKVALD